MLFQNKKLSDVLKRYERLISGVFLCVVIFIIWSWTFNVLSLNAWKTPLGYQGDLWFALAIAKSYMTGDINLFLYQYVSTLNAPFVANWNDYAISEDVIFMAMGWLGKVIGLFASANFMLLLAHLLAGLSFWYVCSEFKYRPEFSFAVAIVYAFCHFIMARGLGHLVLTYFWHIPLLLLVLSWVFSKNDIPLTSKKFAFAGLIALICGALNPYYTGMFIQFLGFGLVMHVARKQYSRARFTFILIFITFASFLLMNANVIIYAIENGRNNVTGGRNLASLEIYALKIPELILTPGNHPLKAFVDFSHKFYYSVAFVKGEYWSPYLGFAGLAGLLLLSGTSVYRFAQGKLQLVPVYFWLIIWILLYSMLGGFNLLLGSLGIEYFRATNRYSIFILTISLLFLVKVLSRRLNKSLRIPVALLLVVIGLSEEMQGRFFIRPPEINPIVAQINSDKDFSLSVERQFPNAMVFQLPVAGFPEVGPINKMGDYEHFRPYFYTKTLHYSYGTNKGRGDTDWQTKVALLPPGEMAKKLERYGFSVIMLNKKGFLDNGNLIIDGLLREGKSIIAENTDLVAFKLQPSSPPEPIDSWLKFDSGWSDDEGTHRWSKSSQAKITITNNSNYARTFVLEFKLSSLTPGVVSMGINAHNLGKIELKKPGEIKQFPRTKIILPPGKASLFFDSNIRPVNPQNGDSRLLSFKLSDLIFTSEESLSKDKTENNFFSPGIKHTKIEKNTQIELKSIPLKSEFNRLPLTRFGLGWSSDEATHRWSDSTHAEILITNQDSRPRSYSLEFKMTALTPRIIELSIGSKYLGNVNVETLFKKIQFKRTGIVLPPGETVLSFHTVTLPVKPTNGDDRKLSFQISDFNFSLE